MLLGAGSDCIWILPHSAFRRRLSWIPCWRIIDERPLAWRCAQGIVDRSKRGCADNQIKVKICKITNEDPDQDCLRTGIVRPV
jgi:hypothetical protein